MSELLLKIYEADSAIPLSLHQQFCVEYNNLNNGSLNEFIKKKSDEKGYELLSERTASSLKTLHKDYQKHIGDAFIARKTLEAGSLLVTTIIDSMAAPVSETGIGTVVVKGTQIMINESLKALMKEFENSVAERSDRIVGVHLNLIRKETGKTMEDISGMSVEDANKLVFGSQKGIMDENINFLDKEAKQTAILELTKILGDKLTHATALNKLENIGQQVQLDDLKEDIKFIAFKHKLQEEAISSLRANLGKVESSLTVLTKGIEVIKRDVANNTENIDILKSYVFSDADVDGKIKLLESGIMGEPGSEKYEKLHNQLTVLKAKKDLEQNVEYYVGQANHILTIANNLGDKLGIDPKTLKKANEIANVANVAASAFLAYSSGNPVAAVAAISGLFGGGGSDPGASRQAELLRVLGIINEKLDAIVEMQKTIIDLQKKILKALEELKDYITVLHTKQMNKMEEIIREVLVNRSTMAEYFNRNIKPIKDFVNELSDEKKKKGNANLTYDQVRSFFANQGFRFQNGKNIFLSALSATDKADPVFLVATYLGELKKSGVYPEFLDGFIALTDYVTQNNLHSKLNELMLTVTFSIPDLERKIRVVDDKNLEAYYGKNQSLYDYLYFDSLEYHFNLLRTTHHFFLLQKGDSEENTYSIEEFYDEYADGKFPFKGKSCFDGLLFLTNTAIIQENILSGDFLLKSVYEKLIVEKIKTNDPGYEKIVRLIKSNKIFSHNLTNYIVYRQLKKMGMEYFEFALYLSDTSAFSNIKHCFEQELRPSIVFHKDVKAWVILLDTSDEGYLILPNEKKYNNGILFYRQEMYYLHTLKHLILDELSNYESGKYFKNVQFKNELLIN